MIKKILVSLHPGYVDTPAVDRAHAIGRKLDAEIMLYSAVYDEYMVGRHFGDDPELVNLRCSMLKAATRKLERVKERLTGIKSVTINAEWQYPIAEGITKAARQFGADLIIASGTRHSALARLTLTNTDWAILRQAQVPVLISHHREFRPFKTVLAAIDPTHPHDETASLDDEIIRQGRQLSELFSGTLHLGHAYPSQNNLVSVEYTLPVEIAAKWKHAHEQAVSELAERHGVAPELVHMIAQEPNAGVPAMAQAVNADLVVIGSMSRSSLANLWIGRTTEHVIDHLECDVLAIPGSGDHVNQQLR